MNLKKLSEILIKCYINESITIEECESEMTILNPELSKNQITELSELCNTLNVTEKEIDGYNCPYKDGELIWVKIDGIWELRYSNGTLDKEGHAYVYKNQKREGRIYRFSQHRKANNIELPKD
jgi:hypothetical protein